MLFKSLLVAGASAATLRFDAEEAKNRPVSKVITLLKDMQVQLQKEVEEDEAIYEKMACWCTTNDKEKTKAIADGEARIQDLTASIEEGSGKSAQLTTEIKNLEKEVSMNQAALDKATAMRQKQLAEFNAEEKDLLQSIGGLKSAITVLKKHNSFLQTSTAEMNGVTLPNIAMMLRHQLNKYNDVMEGAITRSQRKTVEAFVEAPAYANQSGEIFGILKNMRETFEANLESSQKEEATNQQSYEDLKAAKTEEIKSGQDQVDKKTDELAATDEKLGQDKVDKEDTEKTLAADEEFLSNLKEKCQQTDQEYEARSKERTNEIAAVSKALEFLSSDEAHDLFTSTFNFVQIKAVSQNKREVAASILAKAAVDLKRPQLSAMATSVRLDAFVKVKQAIDDMISALKKEQADEVKHKDFCTDGLNENESKINDKERNKSDLIAKSEQLDAKIKSLTAAIEELDNDVKEMIVQMKRAGEDREKENLAFQKTVAEQRATVQLLTKAMEVLKGFYEKSKKGVALMEQPAGPPPPAGFKSYEKNAGGGGVIGMITQIVNDAKAMEAEATRDETDAQQAYESFVKETNTSVTTKQENIVNKKESRGTAEGDLSQAKTELDDTVTELEQLANEKKDLHSSCDFTLKNFDIRQEARSQEVEALAQAKSILSGAK
jgi:chromosome segregation ATPase